MTNQETQPTKVTMFLEDMKQVLAYGSDFIEILLGWKVMLLVIIAIALWFQMDNGKKLAEEAGYSEKQAWKFSRIFSLSVFLCAVGGLYIISFIAMGMEIIINFINTTSDQQKHKIELKFLSKRRAELINLKNQSIQAGEKPRRDKDIEELTDKIEEIQKKTTGLASFRKGFIGTILPLFMGGLIHIYIGNEKLPDEIKSLTEDKQETVVKTKKVRRVKK